MLRARVRIWAVLAVFILAAVFCAHRPLIAWFTSAYWTPRPPHPMTSQESASLIGSWCDVESRPAPQMLSIPFEVAADRPDSSAGSMTVENDSSAPIRNIWFYRDGMPNFYDAEAIVASVTAGKRTETEKVLALWQLFPAYYYNYQPLPCDALQLDPSTLLAVLGTAQCSDAATVLSTLCQLAGCETRIVGIQFEDARGLIAHCTMEVKADGRWIFMDPDGHALYRRADGEWASAADLVADPSPVRNSPHAYYDPALLADAFQHGDVRCIESNLGPFSLARRQTDPACYSSFRHMMRYDLLPGAKTTLYPQRMDRAFLRDPPLYCNGELRWSYRPQDFANGDCRGVIAENLNFSTRDGALVLRRREAGKPAALLIPFTSPYLMVGTQMTGVIETPGNSTSQKARLYALPYSRLPRSATFGWTEIGSVRGAFNCSFDRMFADSPLFGYALKIEVPPAGAVVRSLEVITQLQAAPRALPYLEQGQNRLILYTEQPAAPLPAESSPAGDRSIVFSNGLKITFSPGIHSDSLTAPLSLPRVRETRPDAVPSAACVPD